MCGTLWAPHSSLHRAGRVFAFQKLHGSSFPWKEREIKKRLLWFIDNNKQAKIWIDTLCLQISSKDKWMITKSVSQQGSMPSIYTSIILSRPGSKSFSELYLGQAVTGSQFNTLLVIHSPRSVIQQLGQHKVRHKDKHQINQAVKSISYLAPSNQTLNQPSSF